MKTLIGSSRYRYDPIPPSYPESMIRSAQLLSEALRPPRHYCDIQATA